MSDNFKKLLNNKTENNQLTSENNEITFEYSTDENKNIINQDNNDRTDENDLATEKILNVNIDTNNNEEIEIEDEINNEQKSEVDEGSQVIEDELPLITLKFISICQCCKNKFNKGKYLPYLLKCGHFFCLNCINQYFTDKTGIVCPSDGLMAKSVKELKLLKNLILNQNTKNKKKETKKKKKIKTTNNNYENSDYYNYMKSNLQNYNPENNINNNDTNNNYKINYCRIHKNQKLTHIICDTNEIICVHCAFEMLKLNPSLQIKEIKEKYNDLSSFIDDIMNNSQKNIDIIQNTIELIRKNKENEIKKVKFFYNNLVKYLEAEKKSKIQKIETISKDNIHNLEQKLLIFNEIIEQGDEFLYNLEKHDGDINQNYSSVINNYNNILKLNQSNHADNNRNKLKYIKFISTDSTHLKEYLNKMANINIINRIIKYNINIKKEEESDILKSLNNYASNINNATSMRYYKRIVKKQLNKKSISSESLMEQRSQNESSNYNYLNNTVKMKNSDNFKNIHSNSNTYEINNNNKTMNTSKTPMVNPQYKKISLQGKLKLSNNRSLLKNYFDLKNKDNYDNKLNEENNLFFRGNESVKSQKNSKSFNNLNILNNFYNLDYSRRSPNNNEINRKKFINEEQIKLYKDSLNKLIPKQLKDVNFD